MEEELAELFSVVEKDGFDRKFEASKKMVQWLINNTQKLQQAHQIINKRERVEQDCEMVEQVVKKPKKEPEEDTDFVCPGQMWMEPAEPCVDKKNKHVAVGIKWNNKNWKVCKDCRNAKSRYMKKQNIKAE